MVGDAHVMREGGVEAGGAAVENLRHGYEIAVLESTNFVKVIHLFQLPILHVLG